MNTGAVYRDAVEWFDATAEQPNMNLEVWGVGKCWHSVVWWDGKNWYALGGDLVCDIQYWCLLPKPPSQSP